MTIKVSARGRFEEREPKIVEFLMPSLRSPHALGAGSESVDGRVISG